MLVLCVMGSELEEVRREKAKALQIGFSVTAVHPKQKPKVVKALPALHAVIE